MVNRFGCTPYWDKHVDAAVALSGARNSEWMVRLWLWLCAFVLAPVGALWKSVDNASPLMKTIAAARDRRRHDKLCGAFVRYCLYHAALVTESNLGVMFALPVWQGRRIHPGMDNSRMALLCY